MSDRYFRKHLPSHWLRRSQAVSRRLRATQTRVAAALAEVDRAARELDRVRDEHADDDAA